jgi:ABC-type multidrug transport system ATPase subunit
MNRGRLIELGRLEELRNQSQANAETNRIEILTAGADVETMQQLLSTLEGASVAATASGVRVEITDEREVDAVLAALRHAKGRLVSVQPIKQSLEELFMREVKQMDAVDKVTDGKAIDG